MLYNTRKDSAKWKKMCFNCKQYSDSEQSTKVYTIKELVMMETITYNSHTSLYIPDIQKLELHIPRVKILGTNHYGESCQTAFKRRK